MQMRSLITAFLATSILSLSANGVCHAKNAPVSQDKAAPKINGAAGAMGAQKIAAASKSKFGRTTDGVDVEEVILRNQSGMVAKVITYGATLVELWVPGSNGKTDDVVLGFDNVQDYEKHSPYFGATIGRVANRIAGGTFELPANSKTVIHTPINEPKFKNTLHGGNKGFDKRVWKIEKFDPAIASATFSYVSPNGEEGFPGTLTSSVTYSLNDRNELTISYTATTDRTTVVNLTNHSYFNLAGAGHGKILDHMLEIDADRYQPVNANMIPTDEFKSVVGTPFDFRKSTAIGARIAKLNPGYDHNFVLNRWTKNSANEPPVHALTVSEQKSGRTMEILTTEPGIQFYSGNWLDVPVKGMGGTYKKYEGFCLETQHFPDSVHHPEFPSIVLQPGQTYSQKTIHRFTVAVNQ